MTSHKGPAVKQIPAKVCRPGLQRSQNQAAKPSQLMASSSQGRDAGEKFDQLDDVVRFLILRRCVRLFGLGLQFF